MFRILKDTKGVFAWARVQHALEPRRPPNNTKATVNQTLFAPRVSRPQHGWWQYYLLFVPNLYRLLCNRVSICVLWSKVQECCITSWTCKNFSNDASALALQIFGWILSIPWLVALGYCVSKCCPGGVAVDVQVWDATFSQTSLFFDEAFKTMACSMENCATR